MPDWKTLEETIVFAARPFMEIVRQKVDLGNNRIIDDFYQVHLRPMVVTIPVLENGNILTLHQYKHGPGRHCLTFPAGFRDPGESAEAACQRELLEETGLKAARTAHLGEFVDNGNQRGCIGNYFVSTGCRTVQDPDSGDLEDMSLEEMSVAAIDQALADNRIAIIHHAACWSMARLRGFVG